MHLLPLKKTVIKTDKRKAVRKVLQLLAQITLILISPRIRDLPVKGEDAAVLQM